MKLASGEGVAVYAGEGKLVLQVRRLVHGADDPLAASFKSAVVLTPAEAVRVAAELLTLAAEEVRQVLKCRSD